MFRWGCVTTEKVLYSLNIIWIEKSAQIFLRGNLFLAHLLSQNFLRVDFVLSFVKLFDLSEVSRSDTESLRGFIILSQVENLGLLATGRLAWACVHLRWLAMTCKHICRDQICTQVDEFISPFGQPSQVNASRVTSINLLLANEIEDSHFLNVFSCDLRVLVRKLASALGHPTPVSTQVQLASTPDYLPVRLARALLCVYWKRGHPDNNNQSNGRSETIDSNNSKSSQSNVKYKTMKSQLVRCDARDYGALHFKHSATQNIFFTVCHLLQNKFRSCCLCVPLFLPSFRRPWKPPRSSRKRYRVHCHNSCTFWSLSSFLGHQCIEIASSSKIQTIYFSAWYCQSVSVLKLRQKQKTASWEPSLLRDHCLKGFFYM